MSDVEYSVIASDVIKNFDCTLNHTFKNEPSKCTHVSFFFGVKCNLFLVLNDVVVFHVMLFSFVF